MGPPWGILLLGSPALAQMQTCTRTDTHMYTDIHAHKHAHTHMHADAHAHTQMYTHTRRHAHPHMHTHLCTCRCTCTHRHRQADMGRHADVHTDAYKHACRHAHACRQKCMPLHRCDTCRHTHAVHIPRHRHEDMHARAHTHAEPGPGLRLGSSLHTWAGQRLDSHPSAPTPRYSLGTQRQLPSHLAGAPRARHCAVSLGQGHMAPLVQPSLGTGSDPSLAPPTGTHSAPGPQIPRGPLSWTTPAPRGNSDPPRAELGGGHKYPARAWRPGTAPPPQHPKQHVQRVPRLHGPTVAGLGSPSPCQHRSGVLLASACLPVGSDVQLETMRQGRPAAGRGFLTHNSSFPWR